ncbi:MAG: DUF3127 domain-containing protein [Cyclobacteriaceae bacterium]|nr:DUF3127 domain-containing protein [Cyclobacteriaceae bacterium]MCH8517181.1 DUF3127 domain-containing protein [Cyclobacteriaceae bacterium]
MELVGKIIKVNQEISGQGKNGTWRKQEVIVETEDQYPKQVCVTVWGEKIDQMPLQEGKKVNIGINIESREYNGRWYTDVKAWKMDEVSAGGAAPQTGAQSGQSQAGGPPPDDFFTDDSQGDPLPF